MLKLGLLLAASVAGVQVMSAGVEGSKPAGSYESQIQAWRTQRVERLKSPNGWLSLIGLEWLKEGKNSVGSGKKKNHSSPSAATSISVSSVMPYDSVARIAAAGDWPYVSVYSAGVEPFFFAIRSSVGASPETAMPAFP